MAKPTIDECYDYYISEYGGELPREEFKPIAKRMEMRLDELTFGREIPDDMENRYKMAMCELVEYSRETMGEEARAGISSETTDGYSVTYTGEYTLQTRMTNEKHIAQKYLTYPVNLMYCGVKRCRPMEP